MSKLLMLCIATALFGAQMVVYHDFAYVREQRAVENGIIAPLPKRIDKDSLTVCGAKGFYIRHAKGLQKILQDHLRMGEQVRFQKQGKILEGRILSVDPLIIQGAQRLYFDVHYRDILYTRPLALAALHDRIELRDARVCSCQIAYLVDGVRWSSHYVAEVGKRLHLRGFVRLRNESGYDFEDLELSVVAGTIRRSGVAYPQKFYKAMAASEAAVAVQERSVEGYRRYRLAGRWDLRNGDDVWIPYIDRKVAYSKRLRCRCVDLGYNFGKREYRFKRLYHFQAPQALPKGKIAFYAKDLFLGEGRIPDRAKGEEVSLVVGEAFDLLLQKRVLDFRSTKRRLITKVEYRIHNAKKEKVVVEIDEILPFSDYRIESGVAYRKKSAKEIGYSLKIPAQSTKRFVVTYTFTK